MTAAALVGLACASPGMPPGGPPDTAAPQVVAIVPDTGRTGVKPKEVIFRFDEVVSERPASATTLADLFLISPRDGTPDVSWHREEIRVRPRRGWLANTTYTVIMQAGLSDIRGNVRNTGASTFFSTGSVIPHTRLTGRVFDWASGAPAKGAFVESFVRPDTIHSFIALADSTGAFALERLPSARYTVRAYVDANKNQAIDPGEPWDSSSVSLTDSVATELFVFVHDTLPPRIRDVSFYDSLSLKVTFDKPVDPTQKLSAANFSVIGPDSATVRIASAGAQPADTTAPKSAMTRPRPVSDFVLSLGRRLTPRTTYRVRAIGIRGLLGQTGDSERPFAVPAPPPPQDSVKKSPASGSTTATPPPPPPPRR